MFQWQVGPMGPPVRSKCFNDRWDAERPGLALGKDNSKSRSRQTQTDMPRGISLPCEALGVCCVCRVCLLRRVLCCFDSATTSRCRVLVFAGFYTRRISVCRVPVVWHSAKRQILGVEWNSSSGEREREREGRGHLTRIANALAVTTHGVTPWSISSNDVYTMLGRIHASQSLFIMSAPHQF